MKLNKKELKNLSLQLDYYQQNKEDYSRELLTLRQTLKMLNILTVVEIEVLKLHNKRYTYAVDNIVDLINKAYDNKKGFNVSLLQTGVYTENLDFMDRLTDEEKQTLKACISLVKF